LKQQTVFRTPLATDGPAVHHLIARCPPLDRNSRYCNLLQCTHFAATSVLAEHEGAVVGFISGYLDPRRSDTLFVWQVAVAPQSRGQQLARHMLNALLQRDACAGVAFLTTSITPDNSASWRTFERFAASLGAPLTAEPSLAIQGHFEGCHDGESLVRIGPFASVQPQLMAMEASR
jgi:L-2,4-diaminobutyric acid acetyltransferase